MQKSAIVQSNYPGCKGLSGAPVVTVIENNELRVVGVHVGVHGESAYPTADSDDDGLKELATRADESDAISTLSHASHGLRFSNSEYILYIIYLGLCINIYKYIICNYITS